jgi:dCTP diphosphatase
MLFMKKKYFFRVFIMIEVIDVSNIKKILANFAKMREWEKFHSPKNLSMAIAGEAGELLEIFQWFTEQESINIENDLVIKEKVSQELADIILYTILIADKLSINLNDAIHNKILDNNIKYPVNKVKGSAKKYTEY